MITFRRRRSTPAAAMALCAGALFASCSDPVGMEEGWAGRAQAAAHPAPLDISGEWSFARDLFIHLTPLAAALFGLEPEGPRTTIRCAATGTMVIVQDGAVFTGSLTQESVCTSRGGQVVALSELNDLEAGRIDGRSISFTLLGEPGPVACPVHGQIATTNGVPASLSGTWQCREPGHPKSIWEGIAPPRLGPSLARWTAVRP